MYFFSEKTHWNVHPAKDQFIPWPLEAQCCNEEGCQVWFPRIPASWWHHRKIQKLLSAHTGIISFLIGARFIHAQLPRCCVTDQNEIVSFQHWEIDLPGRYLKVLVGRLAHPVSNMEIDLKSQVNIRMLPSGHRVE